MCADDGAQWNRHKKHQQSRICARWHTRTTRAMSSVGGLLSVCLRWMCIDKCTADPDRSNPTRNRMERPLDTIRSFHAAAEGTTSHRGSYTSRPGTRISLPEYTDADRNSFSSLEWGPQGELLLSEWILPTTASNVTRRWILSKLLLRIWPSKCGRRIAWVISDARPTASPTVHVSPCRRPAWISPWPPEWICEWGKSSICSFLSALVRCDDEWFRRIQ